MVGVSRPVGDDEILDGDGLGQPAGPGKTGHGPQPGDASNRQLEGAGPVDPPARGIRVQPRRELADEGFGITVILGQEIGLAQRDEMRVPIELPSDLLIACDGRIQVSNRTPMGISGPLAR